MWVKFNTYVHIDNIYTHKSYLFVLGVKGPTVITEYGEKKVQLNDPFTVFQCIKGTPKYWGTSKNDLSAKNAQLGSFHIFYTFSCAEMR